MFSYPMIIAGEKKASKDKISVRFPFTGEVIHSVSSANRDDLEKALYYGKQSFAETKSLTIRQRQDILRRLSITLSDRHDDFAQVICHESGKTITEARGEVSRAIETIRLSINAIEKLQGSVLPFSAAPNGADKWGFYERFPLGMAAFITPFNFPLNLVMHKVAPAIAVGCPFILKPASQTPLTALILGDAILEAGYPKRAVSVLSGSGSEIGIPLVSAAEVKTVSFTGSPEVGELIAKKAGMKRVALELGSNSAAIIDDSYDDDELLRASSRIALGAFALAGQVCISTQRVYVHQSCFDKFIKYLKQATDEIVVGDPRDDRTKMSSMVSEAEAKKVHQLIQNSDGEVVHGGNFIKYPKSWMSMLEPTIIVNPSENSTLIADELFAPVVCIVSVDSFDEAIDKVEQSQYGLQVGVFTNDIDKAREAFDRITVGGVIVNDVPTYRADLMPYGGEKRSGMLREGPEFAIEHLTYTKAFVVARKG